jgi:hypothetical protein
LEEISKVDKAVTKHHDPRKKISIKCFYAVSFEQEETKQKEIFPSCLAISFHLPINLGLNIIFNPESLDL